MGLILSYLLLSILYIFSIFSHKLHLKKETTRKIIHITISNWYILAMIYFDELSIAILPPLTFIIFNTLAYKYHFMKSIERNSKDDLGMIYYPISLSLLVAISFGYLDTPYVGLIGTLIMGYGDGLAALIGTYYGKKKLYKNKSLVGSLTMFCVTFLVCITILTIFNPVNIFWTSLMLASVATILELVSIDGFDNVTVPLITTFLYIIFFL